MCENQTEVCHYFHWKLLWKSHGHHLLSLNKKEKLGLSATNILHCVPQKKRRCRFGMMNVGFWMNCSFESNGSRFEKYFMGIYIPKMKTKPQSGRVDSKLVDVCCLMLKWLFCHRDGYKEWIDCSAFWERMRCTMLSLATEKPRFITTGVSDLVDRYESASPYAVVCNIVEHYDPLPELMRCPRCCLPLRLPGSKCFISPWWQHCCELWGLCELNCPFLLRMHVVAGVNGFTSYYSVFWGHCQVAESLIGSFSWWRL